MSSLFRSLHSFSAKRENAIKEALINTLSESSREIEYEANENGTEILDLCELSNALCTALEAIFLHGLKDSFLWQTINAIAGDEDRRPEPSFWSPLMVFLHKQVIEQIQALSQITSEIGQCRAWIRLSLNESLFSSYMNNINRYSSALSPYYKRYALMKDSGGLEAAAKIMQDLEACVQFNLPINSSLLNQWPDYSLQLSGLWTPPLKSCPISSGVDVAGSLRVESSSIPMPQPLQTNELFSESISNSPFSRASNFGVEDLNQRENLDLFLQKVDEMAIIDEEDAVEAAAGAAENQQNSNEENPKESPSEQQNFTTNISQKRQKSKKRRKHSRDHTADMSENEFQSEDAPAAAQPIGHGNSLTNFMQTSWSSDINQTPGSPTSDDGSSYDRFYQRSVSMTSSTSSLRSPMTDRCSYNALLKKHERNRELDWTEVWEKFLMHNTAHGNTPAEAAASAQDNAGTQDNAGPDGDHDTDNDSNSDFEVLQNTVVDKFSLIELQELVEQMCRLPREPGLDVQGFLCKSCQHPLGIGYTNFRVCAFSGNYFCQSCMDVEPVLIPSRIIFNWDFRKYHVSKRAMAFLAEFRSQPFFDLKLLNPDIYNASEAMAELQSLRIRLNFIRAYLSTCDPSSIELLQQQYFGREYLYEHIHQYSIGDLLMIQRGTLCQQLQKAYKIGEMHVLRCPRCSVKGFICEICRNPRVLYPFHIDTTYRCATCGAVFHAQCLNAHQPCPRCERRRKRESALISSADAKQPSNEQLSED